MPAARKGAEQVQRAHEVYRGALERLTASGVPFLVGGAYAFGHYTGIQRFTKDFDVFVKVDDLGRALAALAEAGFRTSRPFPHWLAKAHHGDDLVDVIYSSGNGVARVDDEWFSNGVDAAVLGLPARLVGPAEIIWSKSFIMERERYDGADIAHLLRSSSTLIDWVRLVERFGSYWRVLFSHLVLFGFIYPGERSSIPIWVVEQLTERLSAEIRTAPATERVCRGTILSREQYLPDVERWRYQDARVFPLGHMSEADTAIWTAAIGRDD
jgi:hypothetical protein